MKVKTAFDLNGVKSDINRGLLHIRDIEMCLMSQSRLPSTQDPVVIIILAIVPAKLFVVLSKCRDDDNPKSKEGCQ